MNSFIIPALKMATLIMFDVTNLCKYHLPSLLCHLGTPTPAPPHPRISQWQSLSPER